MKTEPTGDWIHHNSASAIYLPLRRRQHLNLANTLRQDHLKLVKATAFESPIPCDLTSTASRNRIDRIACTHVHNSCNFTLDLLYISIVLVSLTCHTGYRLPTRYHERITKATFWKICPRSKPGIGFECDLIFLDTESNRSRVLLQQDRQVTYNPKKNQKSEIIHTPDKNTKLSSNRKEQLQPLFHT